jgi:L-alanine-DL-glutamate epimerase-like enolase superfamily enzyme
MAIDESALPVTPIEKAEVQVFRIPTEQPESDGTLAWSATIMVLARLYAGGHAGLGYTYSAKGAAGVVAEHLFPILRGRDAFDISGAWFAMAQALRNIGRPGIGGAALSAVDCALWDLKARILGVPLATLLGRKHVALPAYGSGGFTSYSRDQLVDQLRHWAEQGLPAVKMKVGRAPEHDVARVAAARDAIGPATALFVDANGAYSRKQALQFAMAFGKQEVSWFEEPVSSDDLAGLRLIGDRAPPGMDVSAGEYVYDLFGARRLVESARIDVLQADITRCGGVSEFLRLDALCQAHCLPFSSHTAPAIHLPVCAACQQIRHMEYFHDHVRIEHMLFDGAPTPDGGLLTPDLSRPGLGLEVKETDARAYIVS